MKYGTLLSLLILLMLASGCRRSHVAKATVMVDVSAMPGTPDPALVVSSHLPSLPRGASVTSIPGTNQVTIQVVERDAKTAAAGANSLATALLASAKASGSGIRVTVVELPAPPTPPAAPKPLAIPAP